jgi:CBS domain-containing protein
MILGQGGSIFQEMGKITLELVGSVVFGLIGGGIMVLFLRYVHQQKERMLAITVGMLLCMIGLASALHLDVILVTMAMGLLLINRVPHRSEELFKLIRSFSGPIYVMFFVLVGARLGFANMPLWLWGVVIVYVIGRSAGKILGCFMGAKLSGASEVVQKYSGAGILAQGGVAIGLSIMASQHLGHIMITDAMSLGEIIVSAVTATTLIVQIVGPAMVKFSVRWAGENDRNITEVDVAERLTAAEAAMTDIQPLTLTDRLSLVLERFVSGKNLAYPVVDTEGKLAGMLTLTHLREILLESDCWDWMVVADVLVDAKEKVLESTPLKEALQTMTDFGLEQLPVVAAADGKAVGILDTRHARKIIQQEMIRLQTQR